MLGLRQGPLADVRRLVPKGPRGKGEVLFSRVATISNKDANDLTFVTMLSSMNSCVPNGAFRIDVPAVYS